MAERLIDPAGKILRHPDVLAKIRRGEAVWPLNVELDLSNACNLKCAHCDFAHVHDGAMLPTDLAEGVLSELAEGGTQAVTLTGGGEPTLHPALARVAWHAHAAGLKVGLYTNGQRLAPLEEAAGALTWVYVSLDAADPDSYAAAKRAQGFWRALDTVSWLAECRTAGQPAIGLGFLITKANWPDAPVMVGIARSSGADYCQLRPVVGLADYAWVSEALPSLAALAGERVYVSVGRFRELAEATPRSYALCRASALVPCVGATGEVWVCPNTRGISGRRLGDLHAETFGSIWARRSEQRVGSDCRVACRNGALNETLEAVCQEGAHDAFV